MLMGAASGEVVSLHERGPGGYTVSALTFSRFAYRPRHPSVGRAGSAAASSPAISPSRAHLVYVPGGHVRPAECITALPNRAVYNVSAAEAPRAGCETTASDAPAVQIYAADAHLKSAAPLTSLTADWVVPPLPKSHPIFGSQVVYFWPGFKATAPEMGYPVLQPVLQYGEHGRSWALHAGAHEFRLSRARIHQCSTSSLRQSCLLLRREERRNAAAGYRRPRSLGCAGLPLRRGEWHHHPRRKH